MRGNVRLCGAMVAAVGLLACAGESAYAQLHGVTIAKGCLSPVCEGAETNCDVEFGYNDGWGDTIKILAAWDVQDFGGDNVRVPDIGDLPIVLVGGNTTCTVGGALPCVIGPGGSTLGGLPGDPQPGFVRFNQDTYVVQPDDPDALLDQAVVQWVDLCDATGTQGCGAGVINDAAAPASTRITRCDDGNDCTTDTCADGACTFAPDCLDDADCDDGDACTSDVCTAEGCCEDAPITCDDANDCTTDTCDPATGCVFTPDCASHADCDDGDACTRDACTGEGCCANNPIICGDTNDCTTDTCEPATGCVFTPDCTADADCDDGDACTMDVCTAEGCCENNPITCDDGDECTEDTCDPTTGCVHTPIEPPPPGCEGGDGCTPGFWKQPHHLQYWMNHDPADMFEVVFGVDAIVLDGKTLVEVLWTGGGHEAALGRHAVAALLNAASNEVGYAFTENIVIGMVQQAYATGDFNGIKNTLAEENERGCTVSKWRDPTRRPNLLRGSRKGR